MSRRSCKRARAVCTVRFDGPVPSASSRRLRIGEEHVEVVGPSCAPSRLVSGLDDLRDELSPGERVELEVESRAGERTVELTLAADPALEVVTFEAAGRDTTPEILAFRAAWLGPKATPRTTVHRYCPESGEPYPLAYAHCPVHGSELVLVPPE